MKKLSMEEINKAVEESSRRLSKKHVFNIEFYEKDLFMLRKRYEKQHAKARKQFPKLVGDYTDTMVIKYAIWELNGKETRKFFNSLQKKKSS